MGCVFAEPIQVPVCVFSLNQFNSYFPVRYLAAPSFQGQRKITVNHLNFIFVFSVPHATVSAAAVGKPADDILSANVPSAFPRPLAAPPGRFNGSAVIPWSATDDVPNPTNAGKLVVVVGNYWNRQHLCYLGLPLNFE